MLRTPLKPDICGSREALRVTDGPDDVFIELRSRLIFTGGGIAELKLQGTLTKNKGNAATTLLVPASTAVDTTGLLSFPPRSLPLSRA
jgi:hypothetical protein